jgi:hypothetical protein
MTEHSRRTFVRTTGLAGAALAFGTGSAAGYEGIAIDATLETVGDATQETILVVDPDAAVGSALSNGTGLYRPGVAAPGNQVTSTVAWRHPAGYGPRHGPVLRDHLGHLDVHPGRLGYRGGREHHARVGRGLDRDGDPPPPATGGG